MDFSWTDEQLAFRDEVRRFAEAELNGDVRENDAAGFFSWDKWKACASFGILGLNVPKEYGGQGKDILTTILAMEALGYGCRENGLPFALNSQMWSVQPAILKFGTEEQKARYLPPLCRGEVIGSFGITELDTGSDSYAMKTRADKVDGGYVLNGRKTYITSAPIGDLAVVFAVTDETEGRWGISGFVVEEGTEGFKRSEVREKMGLRSAHMGDLIFEDCFVSDGQRLGAEGAGVSMFTAAMESERSYIFASQVGRMERQLEEAVAYAREREAFGQAVGKFQGVSNRIVEMKLRLETARLLMYKVAWLEHTEQPLLMEASLAKLHLSRCFVDSSLDAICVHGARGYVSEFEVERDLRDGVGGLLYSGTSEIQQVIIARLMGL
ncbi:MAG: acyl-CoA dehydrogenase family protein [Verrucomicrobiota bacterium]